MDLALIMTFLQSQASLFEAGMLLNACVSFRLIYVDRIDSILYHIEIMRSRKKESSLEREVMI